jgi:MOSC domain-containing protein YiiM
LLVRGSIGENLSVNGWDETTVCIGDVFRLGAARIQVSQPRSPCWKIDRRYAQEGMAKLIDAKGIAGWYFRVVEEGEVAPGCRFEREDHPAPAATLQRLWELWKAQRPYPAALDAFAATPGLAPNWSEKFTERARWLRSL